MFAKNKEDKAATIQELIDGVTSQMMTYDAFSDEYAQMLEQLEKLHKLRMNEKTRSRPSMDTVVAAASSLAGIITIVSFEHSHALTSKALGFVAKVKV